MAAAQKLFLRCLQEPKARILVVRKVARTLLNSVFELLKTIIAEAGMSHYVRFVRGQEKAIHFRNGSAILFTGCDNADKLKSIQGITSVWVEEATELTEGDFSQLELRVRGETPGYKQFLLTFNPIDQSHWLHSRFFLDSAFSISARNSPPCPAGTNQGGVAEGRGGLKRKLGGGAQSPDLFILHTTYRDNALLDEAYKKHLEETLRRDENLFRIYALGQWGHLKRGGEFYKQFSMAKHVATAKYKKRLPLHVSFDFNLNPYITMTVWQFEGKGKGMEARQIDELCLSNPENSTPALCKAFLGKYGNHAAGLSVYGDPSGAKGNTQTAGRSSDYAIIYEALAGMQPRRKVAASAPEVAKRGLFINSVLMGGVEGIRIKIDPVCVNTIADYQNLQENTDGSKIKEMHTDRNGVRSQKYGHCSDANDYLLCKVFESQFRKSQGKGRLPMAVFGRDYD
jgi:PBSX family phage terminase large subunit